MREQPIGSTVQMDPETGDAELLERGGRGDEAAWGALLERHGPFVLGVAVRRLKRAGFGRAEAEEVVQELWVALLRGAARAARLEGGLRPYLAVSVLNRARTWLRGRARDAARDRSHPVHPEGVADDIYLHRESVARLHMRID